MKILLSSQSKDLQPWLTAFRANYPSEQIVSDYDTYNPNDITTAVVWNHRKGLLAELPHLRHVASMGAGVEHILVDPDLPPEVVVTRVVSQGLSVPMTRYCLGAILYYEKQFDKYLVDQQGKIWHQEMDPERHMTIGIMGLGELGSDLAKALVQLGFTVLGWSKTRKNIPGVTSYEAEEIDAFLQKTNGLIGMLPATPETRGIFNKELFGKLPSGSIFINVGRGSQQVNEDILDALNNGQLSGTFLDVFPIEPLPANDPLWSHPKVKITPHIAVVTLPSVAAPVIVDNHVRLLKGESPLYVADRSKGY